MNKKMIVEKLVTSFNKVKFKAKKRSPEIFLVAGLIGVTTATVVACKATTKIDGILEESKSRIDTIHECAKDEALAEYDAKDEQKDLYIVYVQTGVQVVKLYAPAFILMALSMSSILTSYNVMKSRNLALAAAYVTVDKGFKDYRSRVVSRFGEEVDKELKHGTKAEKIEIVSVDENGKTTKEKKTINVADRSSDFRFFFDAASRYWEKNGEYNRMFLMSQQQYANDRLRANGYLFLNDVLDSLGIERTPEGQILGWIYSEEKSPNGDGYVDFGIYEAYKLDEIDYTKDKLREGRLSGDVYEKTVLLDFNCDGPILDLMR